MMPPYESMISSPDGQNRWLMYLDEIVGLTHDIFIEIMGSVHIFIEIVGPVHDFNIFKFQLSSPTPHLSEKSLSLLATYSNSKPSSPL